MEDDRTEAEAIAPGGIAAEGPRGVPGQQINFTGAKCRKPLRSRERSILHPIGITEESRGHGPADIHIQSRVSPLRTEKTEAWDLAADATEQLPPLLHQLKAGQRRSLHRCAPADQSRESDGGADQQALAAAKHQSGDGSAGIVPDSMPVMEISPSFD